MCSMCVVKACRYLSFMQNKHDLERCRCQRTFGHFQPFEDDPSSHSRPFEKYLSFPLNFFSTLANYLLQVDIRQSPNISADCKYSQALLTPLPSPLLCPHFSFHLLRRISPQLSSFNINEEVPFNLDRFPTGDQVAAWPKIYPHRDQASNFWAFFFIWKNLIFFALPNSGRYNNARRRNS